MCGLKYVDSGEIVTSAGVSAGMDMALHLVARFTDAKTAMRAARRMTFDWTCEG
ncbi:MAG: hypothetical protein ABF868_06310 [Sporolactobacillus sp.]